MELLLALVPPVAALLVIAPIIRSIARTWREAALRLGYEYRSGPFGSLGRIIGDLPHGRIQISLAASETMLIEIDGCGSLPRNLSLQRRGLIPRIAELDTGDHHLDSCASITGTITTVLAALPTVVRMRLARLAEVGRVSLRDGALYVSSNRPRTATDLVDSIVDTIDLFNRMTFSLPIYQRLLENFEQERDPNVRERLFRVLLFEAPDAIRQQAIRRAVSDYNPEIRLSAVKALKAAGWEESVALYNDRKVVGRYRAEALRHLALTFGRERALPLVETGLVQRNPEVCATAVEAIGGWRLMSALPHLEALLARDPSLVERVAAALGRIGGAASERMLLSLLHSEHRSVRQAAIDALGRAGSLDAIPRLSEIKDFGLRGVVREAIGAIQARCGRPAEGALSLTASTAGEGAIALSDESGGMSIVDPVRTRSREK